MLQLFLIQQGTVPLRDKEGEIAQLQNVQGAGDLLGIEQFNDLDAYPHTETGHRRRDLNQRARAFVLRHLTSAGSVTGVK